MRVTRLRGWGYFQLASWRALPGIGMRLRWLRHLLAPDVGHQRVRYGSDKAGVQHLIARRLIGGWQRWRGYHRAAG